MFNAYPHRKDSTRKSSNKKMRFITMCPVSMLGIVRVEFQDLVPISTSSKAIVKAVMNFVKPVA